MASANCFEPMRSCAQLRFLSKNRFVLFGQHRDKPVAGPVGMLSQPVFLADVERMAIFCAVTTNWATARETSHHPQIPSLQGRRGSQVDPPRIACLILRTLRVSRFCSQNRLKSHLKMRNGEPTSCLTSSRSNWLSLVL